MSKFSNILGTFADTKADALKDRTNTKNWNGNLEDNMMSLIHSDTESMKEEDRLRFSHRKKKTGSGVAGSVEEDPIMPDESIEDVVIVSDEYLEEENVSELSDEIESDDLDMESDDEMMESLDESEDLTKEKVMEESIMVDKVDMEQDILENDFVEDIHELDIVEDEFDDFRFKVPPATGFNPYYSKIIKDHQDRVVKDVYDCDTDTFTGRRKAVVLLEGLYGEPVKVTEYHKALEDFHRYYDLDGGKDWLAKEKTKPLSQWGTAWLPYPTVEQLEVLYEWGYQSDGSFIEK